jgi:putative SOS response-associated peptidase YedK
MCYSAQVTASFRTYVRRLGARADLAAFQALFEQRSRDPRIKVPKEMEADFLEPQSDQEAAIAQVIRSYHQEQATRWEQELFKQRKRLADAQRQLQAKITKAATESQRIASTKVDALLARLADLRRTQLLPRDSRIYPGYYAPVLVWEDGHRVVRPMRYQCRPAGKPAFYDQKYPGTYNARRDNLRGFWKAQFGHTHGLMLVQAFYEHVARHQAEGRALRPDEPPQSVILEFRPHTGQDMLVACLWSRWRGAGHTGEPNLLSFAAITDEPPPEVAAAGHDRCIIPLPDSAIEPWLSPDAKNLNAVEALLDERERPVYEHRLAA